MLIFIILLLFSGTSNGDTARNRWPFIRFTVTDIDPNEIISGHSQWRSSPQNAQSSAHTNSKLICSIYLDF